jgi:hypothetical protein
MKIGLYDVDSKIPNLALMKISAFHKQLGDQVEFFKPILDGTYDKVYVSKIFKKTKIPYFPHRQPVIARGIGLSLTQNLDSKMEHIYPDYELYHLDYAMGFVSRGCINKCPFCVVPKKEGLIRFNAPIEEFWRDQKKLLLLDNAITDCPEAINELQKISDMRIRLSLTQGFNIRTITSNIAKILANILFWKSNEQWHIAWDNINDEERVMKGISILNTAGIHNYRLMCYVLTGYNSSLKQDLYRINLLDKLDIDPFVMRFQQTPLLNGLAKWCNKPQLRHSCTFEEFCLQKKMKIEGKKQWL